MAQLLEVGRLAGERAEQIAIDAAPRGFMPIELFSALAQIVAAREPDKIFHYLNALEKIVTARPNVTPNV